jgi:membrane peptidoglycan carboxypeptidase
VGGFVVRFVRLLSVKISELLGFLGIATLCGLLCAALAIPLVAALAYGTNSGVRAFATLPTDLKIPSLDGRSYIYDNTGGLVATLFTQNRVYVPISQIAPVMQTAIVDIEDERFYEHGAADPKGILRALINNNQSSATQGASTITQQYVKNILINDATTPAQVEKLLYDRKNNYAEKLDELRYAIALEQKLTKRQILEGYLNISPFGQTVYGIEAASEYYFDTTAAKLNLPQAAMLAGEVQSPSKYDPTAGGISVGLAIQRRNIVLDKMYSLHHITEVEWAAAKKAPLGIHKTLPKQGCAAASVSQWYCDYIVNTLENSPDFAFLGKTVQERATRLDSGGLDIYTALNAPTQKLADEGMAAATSPTDTPIASTAIVQPGTGNVVAIANSKSYGLNTKAGETETDYAVPYKYGTSIGFQPGSGMKPITMAIALEQGVPLSYRINASSGLYYHDFPYTDCAGDSVNGGPAQIQNEGGESYGSITMLTGIWESVNSYFAQLESKVGLCPVAKLAAKLGVTTVNLIPTPHVTALQQVPTLTLGTNITSPLQMSEVYATLAAHGMYCPPRVVTRVVDADSKQTLYSAPVKCTRVMPADVADAIDWALYHNVQGDLDPKSTATPARISGIPTAGKTGTNDSHQAVWFNGYNSQFAASMVLAMPTTVDKFGNPTTLAGQTLGGRTIATATGGTAAGGVWLSVMKPILEAQKTHPGFPDKPAAKFDAPGQYTGTRVSVPDVVGASASSAEAELSGAQLSWTIASTPVDSTVPIGQVAYTDPSGGSQVDAGSSVTIYLSTGNAPSPTAIPTPSAPPSSPAPAPSPTSRPTATTPPVIVPSPAPSAAPSRPAPSAPAAAGSSPARKPAGGSTP